MHGLALRALGLFLAQTSADGNPDRDSDRQPDADIARENSGCHPERCA